MEEIKATIKVKLNTTLMSLKQVAGETNCGTCLTWNTTQQQKEWSTDTHNHLDELTQRITLSEKTQSQKATYYNASLL